MTDTDPNQVAQVAKNLTNNIIGEIGGESRVLQGIGMTQNDDHGDVRGGTKVIEQGDSSTVTGCKTCAARLEQDRKLRERCASFHKEKYTEEWSATAYFKPHEDPTSVKRGEVYRIWKPDDMVMHRSTVLILLYNGRSWQACKIEKKENAPLKKRNYRHQWAPLHVHKSHEPCEKANMHIEQAELHELTMYPAEDQIMADHCLIDLERSYDIGNEDEYDFVYCGKLDARSYEYARKKHLELYCA